ncbi:hypothetical protein [Winogradskyella aurantia]|uniref:Uncharacterized protein n=1 Tax=Winogradskyella aurantia TaxID=1915063 RepID=A0A265UPB2_9FLAO|nr:hypothetical protein [Winogradskyella aurantia]OZV67161.1 hypothetical protein CA834_12640 [Winogradskyella aurantia]
MAPIKFEEQLKEKLEKRTLSPSEGSWSKLAERLGTEEGRSKKPFYWWLGVAAGLVILMAVTIQFFNNEENEAIIPTLVEEEVETTPKKPTDIIVDEVKTNAVVATDETSNNKNNESTTTKAPLTDYKKTVQNQSKSQTKIAGNRSSLDDKLTTRKGQKPKQDMQNVIGEDELRESVAATLKNFRSETKPVTDREVDSLLKMANKELLKGKFLKDASRTVDATSLLISVEDEMGESFRTKVFEALKDGYETIKTAVVHRNH